MKNGMANLAQVRAYEAPAEPRQPDVAKRTRQQHAEYLAIIDARRESVKRRLRPVAHAKKYPGCKFREIHTAGAQSQPVRTRHAPASINSQLAVTTIFSALASA